MSPYAGMDAQGFRAFRTHAERQRIAHWQGSPGVGHGALACTFIELLSGGTTLWRKVQHIRSMSMKTLQKLVVALVVGSLFGIGVIGCNTISGAGQDIQKGGRAVENSAEDAQRK